MPQKNKIKYTPVAVDDMDEIFSYISKDNVAAAESCLPAVSGDRNTWPVRAGTSLPWPDSRPCR
ncbi:MAG: hypothetical protein Kow00111_09570 [Thermincola ferriacetica]